MQQTIEKPVLHEISHSAGTEKSLIAFTCRNVAELLELRSAIGNFVYNTLRRRYHRSILGFTWSLLNPLLTMVVMTTVFSLVFHMDPRKYGIFIFTGILPWTFMSESINIGCDSIITAETFHKKLYLPKVFFPLVTVCTETINFAMSLTSLMLLFLFLGMKLQLSMLFLPFATLILSIFNLGMAIICAATTV